MRRAALEVRFGIAEGEVCAGAASALAADEEQSRRGRRRTFSDRREGAQPPASDHVLFAHDVPLASRVIAAAGDERMLVRSGGSVTWSPGQHLHEALTRWAQPQPQKK
jgi:hypothetical protein